MGNFSNKISSSIITKSNKIYIEQNDNDKLLNLLDYKNNNNISKWRPNDDLYNQYNKYEKNLCELNKLNINLESFKIKRNKIKEIIKSNENKILNNYDKILVLNNKTNLINIESEIIILENKIKELNQLDNNILDNWLDYNTQISNLIKNNILDISINNLISSYNLYIYLLSLVRQLYNIKEDSIIMNKIKKLNNVIDMKYIVHSSKLFKI